MTAEAPAPEPCGLCSLPLGNHYIGCDQTMRLYHPECFAQTACGRGEHGEGCPTSIFESGETGRTGGREE